MFERLKAVKISEKIKLITIKNLFCLYLLTLHAYLLFFAAYGQLNSTNLLQKFSKTKRKNLL